MRAVGPLALEKSLRARGLQKLVQFFRGQRLSEATGERRAKHLGALAAVQLGQQEMFLFPDLEIRARTGVLDHVPARFSSRSDD